MTDPAFLMDLERCELCEHRCGVNRLRGERGVCRMTTPVVASATLHPAPPESYTIFMAGCNFKCLNCQNWTISQYPDNGAPQRGYVVPKNLAEESIANLSSLTARLMGADRIFFSGGEATIHLPYIEKVVEEARNIKPDIKVNFDTNGYMTKESLERILAFSTSITYDLKAFSKELSLALTGASSTPILRNAEYIGRHAKDKLWEYRILVIPNINESEIMPFTKFVANINPSLPVCFLAFRPNFALENHPGATRDLMDRCVGIAQEAGLENAYWSGHTGIPGKILASNTSLRKQYDSENAWLAGSYALAAGCQTQPRGCAACPSNQTCALKSYIPVRTT